MTNKKSVWATLSAIDCSAKVEQKGKLTYLSWAWAWQTLMEHYPDSTYEYGEAFEEDGTNTMEVNVSVTVEGITHAMWLPVMDNRNKSIVNPTTRDISDARMRCLVKCIAMFGLGIYIYAGEDLPESTKTEVVSAEQAKTIKSLLEQTGADVQQFLKYFKTDSVENMLAINFSRALAALKAKVK
tara:strand:- start:3724 stop:4275 length:552 start_codon:yes stop_codon:yes gene_type:complete